MKLYNTLTRSVEEFTPLNENEVTIYSCGPTVYDHIHIGNLRAFIAADLLRRVLSMDYKVTHVMNFTDVDDKTIIRSQTEYPDDSPGEALQKLTAKYAEIFLRDTKLIGNEVSSLQFVHATDFIPQMQRLICELHAAGLAYVTEDGVYFSIQKYLQAGKSYGQLSEVNATNTSSARIDNDEYDKNSAQDFALWKVQKPGEPAWEFEINGKQLNGRPGWHIECSAMSVSKLGQPFDIHTGGVDLIFPHHENEIAQSTGAHTEDLYASFFLHNEHLLVEDRKMSKSLGNFYTLRDIQDKSYEPLAFRLLALQSHYRSTTNFSWVNLQAAQNRLSGYRMMADFGLQAFYQPDLDTNTVRFFERITAEINDALRSDLDTPAVLAKLNKVETEVTAHYGAFADEAALAKYQELLHLIDRALGLQLSDRSDVTKEQKEMITKREAARSSEDWAGSDRLRDQLLESGIGLNDTPHGTRWYRI